MNIIEIQKWARIISYLYTGCLKIIFTKYSLVAKDIEKEKSS